jgi:hypothetical protein
VRINAAAAVVVAQAEVAVEIAAIRGIHIQISAVFVSNGKALFHVENSLVA